MNLTKPVLSRSFLGTARWLALPVVALTLAACGGGTQVEIFKPSSLVAFGDEASALETQDLSALSANPGAGTLAGLSYTVSSVVVTVAVSNPALPADTVLDTTGLPVIPPDTAGGAPTVVAGTGNASFDRILSGQTINFTSTVGGASGSQTSDLTYSFGVFCNESQIWVQRVAQAYGLGFKDTGCALESASNARTFAAAQTNGQPTKVNDVVAQMNANRAAIGKDALVLVMAGQNDVLEAYAAARAGALSSDAAVEQVRAAGQRLGRGISALLSIDARFIVSNLPSLHRSPYLLQAGQDPALMETLVRAFNQGLTGPRGLTNDGTRIGLVNLFDDSRIVLINASNTANAGFSNGVAPVCDPALTRRPDGSLVDAPAAPFFGGEALKFCSTLTRNAAAVSPDAYYWADPVHLAPNAHARLANLVVARISANPF